MKKIVLIVLLFFELIISADIIFNRTSNVFDEAIKGNISFSISQSLEYSGHIINNNDKVCKGTFNVNFPFQGSFTSIYTHNPNNIMANTPRLPCVTGSCGIAPMITNASDLPSSQTYNLIFVSSSIFNSYRNYDVINGRNTGLTPNTAPVFYHTLNFATYKWGYGLIGIYCYGSKEIYNGNNLLAGGIGLNENSYSLTLQPGSYSISSRASINECAAMGRTCEPNCTNPTTWRDLSLHNSTSFLVTTSPISFTVYNGPNLSIQNLVFSSPAMVGQQVQVTFDIKNNGDVPSRVTGLSLYNPTLGNVQITNLNPSLPIVINPGQTVTFTGNITAPSTTGTYSFQVRATYEATESLIGNCDDSRTESISTMYNLQVVNCPVISATLTISPTTSYDGNVNFQINVSNTGGTQASITLVSIVGLGHVNFANTFPITINPGGSIIISGSGRITNPGSYNINATIYYSSIYPACPTPPVTTNTVSVNVNCPSITATLSIDPDIVSEGDIVNFTIYIENTGPVRITSITFLHLSNLNFDKNFPLTITSPLTIRGNATVGSAGTYNINATINYNSPYLNCPSAYLTTNVVRVSVYGDIRYTFSVNPFSILKIGADYYFGNEKINETNISGKFERIPEIGSLYFNITIEKFNPSTNNFEIIQFRKIGDDLGPSRYCYPSTIGCREVSFARRQSSTVLIFNQPQEFFVVPPFDVGVYRVTVTPYDGTLNKPVRSKLKYFVVYGLSCIDRV